MGRQGWLLLCLGGVIPAGLASRMVHCGLPLLDKYAGDGLYAVMIYLLAALLFGRLPPRALAVGTMLFMLLLETFQLTGIPLAMVTGDSIGLKLVGRLLGTTFSWHDLLAYAFAIAAVFSLEQYLSRRAA